MFLLNAERATREEDMADVVDGGSKAEDHSASVWVVEGIGLVQSARPDCPVGIFHPPSAVPPAQQVAAAVRASLCSLNLRRLWPRSTS